jgi:transglutaminase-like putative cysteine protease
MTAPAKTHGGPAPAKTTAGPDPVVAAATGTVAAGVLLTTLPLRSVFTDWAWLMVSVGCVLPYLAVVALFRLRSAPRGWHSLVGLLASVLMVLWVFVPQHLWMGVLPTPSSLSDIGDLVAAANTSIQREHAPLASTGALRLLVASALVALVALTDVLAVLLRRPLLASAPLLEVLAIASATSSDAAHPVWFACAAGGFLLILLSGTQLQDRAWGPSVDGSAGRLGGARRMAVTGVVAALLVPLVLPSVSVNVLARATHHDGDGDGTGNGSGQIVLNSLAKLQGSLERPKPVPLFRVKADGQPFYVRQEVLDEFTGDGWQSSDVATNVERLGDGFSISPYDPDRIEQERANQSQQPTLTAEFTILALGGTTMPILANPQSVQTSAGGAWDSATATVVNTRLKRGMTYSQKFIQPAPKVAELQAAQPWVPDEGDPLGQQLLQRPDLSQSVRERAATIVAGLTSPYAKAKAISDYFTKEGSGFKYSLTTQPQDGLSALEAFLQNKEGYCQQYAAAAAVLMREAGLPSRVVIGYTHGEPDSNGLFTVTTDDAHAWVEVYFKSIGWIPFDPTPLSGADAGRAYPLAWAPHPQDGVEPSVAETANRGPSASGVQVTAENNQAGGSDGRFGPSAAVLGLVLLVLLVLLTIVAVIFGPQWLRQRQRRRRLERARTTGNPEPLWLELAATATDRDALWPSTVTVGQVAGWLSRHGVDERGRAAVTAVADRVERDRFSAQLVDQVPPESIAALDQALTRWARRTDRRLSLMHRWLPRSLMGQPRWRR